MFKIAKPLQQNGKNHETLLIVSCAINSFLICVSETFQIFSSRFDQMFECWNIMECYHKNKRKTVKILLAVYCLLFFVSNIRLLFESLKLIWQFSTWFKQISACSQVLKYLNIFQKNLPSTNFFLFETDIVCFSIFDYSKFLQAKTIIPNIRNGWNATGIFNMVSTFFMSAPFLCKALIYLPNEDFKLLVKILDVSGPESPDFSVLVVI